MKRLFVSVMIVVCAMVYAGAAIAAPVAPTMTLSTQGQSVSFSWTPVQGATGYTLAYAQYPWLATMTMSDIHYADMGAVTSISFLLWEGAAYYVAVQAYDGQGSSEFSNIDYFVMGPPTPTWIDDDGDGAREVDGDCNDANPSVKPAAQEVCGDGIDQDCNGVDPVCDPNDIDNDGDGLTERQGDCDDTNIYVYPGAVDACGDGIDADCSGVDTSCLDVDNDGDGLTENQGDCNDTNIYVYPGAVDACGDGIDADCNGSDPQCVDINRENTLQLAGMWMIYTGDRQTLLATYTIDSTSLRQGTGGWYLKGTNTRPYVGFPLWLQGTAVQAGFSTLTSDYYIIDMSAENGFAWEFRSSTLTGGVMQGCRYRYPAGSSDKGACLPIWGN